MELITETIGSITKMSEHMAGEQLQGNLELLKVCIRNIYLGGQILSQEICHVTKQFGQWMFSTILFNLEVQHPYIRNLSIRKHCYDIIAILCENEPDFAEAICAKIKLIDIKPKDRNQDYVDFRTTEFIGINNMGATCYINSLLQQIYHTQFSQLFLEIEEETLCLKELKTAFMSLYSSIKNSVDLSSFVKNTRVWGDPINPVKQEDACEFLLSIFDTIDSQPNSKYK